MHRSVAGRTRRPNTRWLLLRRRRRRRRRRKERGKKLEDEGEDKRNTQRRN